MYSILTMPTKLEIWRELGKKYGVPPKGTAEYEQKVQMYQHALLTLPVYEPPSCSCPCRCEAARQPSQPRVQMHSTNQMGGRNAREYDSYDSEEDMGEIRRVARAPIVRRPTPIYSDSDSEVQRPKRGRPPKKVVESESGTDSEDDVDVKRKSQAKDKKKKPPPPVKKKTKKSSTSKSKK